MVVGEERTRDTPGLRSIKAQLGLTCAAASVCPTACRSATSTCIRTAPRERFVDFYHAYYRP